MECLLGRDGGELWTELDNLGGQGGHILPGDEGIHLIQVSVPADHIQGIGADGSGGAQKGQRFHWRKRHHTIEREGVLRKLRRRRGRQKVTVSRCGRYQNLYL